MWYRQNWKSAGRQRPENCPHCRHAFSGTPRGAVDMCTDEDLWEGIVRLLTIDHTPEQFLEFVATYGPEARMRIADVYPLSAAEQEICAASLAEVPQVADADGSSPTRPM